MVKLESQCWQMRNLVGDLDIAKEAVQNMIENWFWDQHSVRIPAAEKLLAADALHTKPAGIGSLSFEQKLGRILKIEKKSCVNLYFHRRPA